MIDKQLAPVWVVIPAAGIGQRMRSELPKQYLTINNKTLIEHTLACFLEHDQIAGIVVVLSADDKYWPTLDIKSTSIPIVTVQGGSNRTDSVVQGLKYLDLIEKIPKNSWVMVHDAARPCLFKTDLDAVLTIRQTQTIGGLLATPVRDTMKRALIVENLNTVSHTEARDNLWHALTPQIFRLDALQEAIKTCQSNGFAITDESSAVEFMGEKPMIVKCTHNNIKVTHPDDIVMAKFLLSEKSKNKEQA